VCWLGGSKPTDQPSAEARAAISWLYEQVGGELKPHSSFKQTDCPGKLDTIIAKLENIENKLKLGNLIR
jgi:hypothetical protein